MANKVLLVVPEAPAPTATAEVKDERKIEKRGIRLGVLDLYRDQTGMLDDAQLREALAFADAATAILLHLQTRYPAPGGGSELTDVIAQRAVVHQATGYVSVQADVGMTEALALLRSRSFSTDRPITSIAQDVLDGRMTFVEDTV